jgi:hypothetical protein
MSCSPPASSTPVPYKPPTLDPCTTGIPARVVSERLGHASVAFTLQVYGHVLPGMDADAAATVAGLILGGTQEGSGTVVPDPSANKIR